MTVALALLVLIAVIALIRAAHAAPAPKRQSAPASLTGDELVSRMHEPPVALAANSWCEFEIVGESHHQDNLRRISGNHGPAGVHLHGQATLVHEATNPHDACAVAVFVEGSMVGHLPRADAAQYVAQMAGLDLTMRLATCPAYVCGGFLDDDGEQASYGVKLGLTWPLSIEHATRTVAI